MSQLADRLPKRFPVGTRYIVEGRGDTKGHLDIRLRYLEFPDGRHLDLPAEPSVDLARRMQHRRQPPSRISKIVSRRKRR
jgi:hypothetical protein